MSTRSLCSPGATKKWHIPKPQSLTRGFFFASIQNPYFLDGQWWSGSLFFLQIPGLLSGPTGAAEASLYVRVEATASLRGGYRLGSWDGARCGIPWRYKDRSGKGCRFRMELYVCYMSSIFYINLYYICLLLLKGTVLSVKFQSLSPWGRDCEPADIAFWKWFGTEGILRIQPWVMQGVVMAVCWCKSTISSAKALWGVNTSRSRAGRGFCWIHHAIWSV